MAHDKTILERAFELAASGNHRSLDTLKRQLKAERYEGTDAHIGGAGLSKQLRRMMLDARKPG